MRSTLIALDQNNKEQQWEIEDEHKGIYRIRNNFIITHVSKSRTLVKNGSLWYTDIIPIPRGHDRPLSTHEFIYLIS